MADNTNTVSSADTSSVTAIKVKVVLDTSKAELDKQFESVKEKYKNSPIKLAFGLNQNETAKNINTALRSMISSGKIITPKVTLDVKIDQSKVTAQLKKAMASAAKQTVKVNTGSVKNSAKANSSDDEFQKLYQLEQKRAKLLVDSAALTANGKKESELKAVNDELTKTNTQMKELYKNIKNVLSEKQKLQLTNMDSDAQFKASRKTLNGTDNATQELKKQQKATEDDLKRTLKQQESIYENRRKQIQALENYAKNNSNYKNSNIQTYLYGEDGTGNTSGKIKELREQLSLIENTDPSKAVKDFDKNCKALDGTLNSTSQHLKELGFDFRDLKQANVDMTKFKSVYERATKLENSISNKSKYSFLIDSINGIKSAASGCEGDVTELSARLSSLEVEANRCGATTETLSQKLSRLFKEHFQTAVAMYGVAMVKQGLREVYNNVVEIDTSMTNLKKVTNETESAYSSFLSSASSQARELGASISDVIDSTAEWSRLGYTLDESQELAKWSTVLSNIGDGIDSASDAASYLVSILKGFRMEADEVEHVVNVLNSVGNNEPISESGIAEALVRSASALSAAGNSFEESVSLISAANSVLQDPDTVGTTLKTISMYLRASKTDAEAFGVSVDDMADSVSELRSELKSLTGVDIMKDSAGTEFKSTYQILKEISAVWDKLTDVSKANVTEMLGGKRNSNAVLSVIEQFSIAEKSMEDAANSSNSAMTEQERMMDSIEGRLKRLNASFEKFSNDVLSSDLVKFFVTLATKIVDAADGMVNLAGSIPAITAAISGVLSVMQMSGKLKNGAGKVNMPSYICCV
ncbi:MULTISPECIES: phage tail tape measure protein [Faecalibacterium]|uniref:phage tail tape measure protein n=1 Tax=Faecalibacterium TaxID=216851 RepID=UPI000E4807F9|nr:MULTISPECIES: phage tail tape measure protein [Faecalibacterium]RHQ27667.1 phage tail tape measure protein [Faecalibacterium sp. AF28-13AC]DAZ79122.1 MAG TPA: minor tail protein [Caudoviricetes sp.]